MNILFKINFLESPIIFMGLVYLDTILNKCKHDETNITIMQKQTLIESRINYE